jgi:hypothetical protein
MRELKRLAAQDSLFTRAIGGVPAVLYFAAPASL